jgi:endonuclease III
MEAAPLQGSKKLHEVMRQQAEQAQQAAGMEQEAMQVQKMLDMAAINQSTALAEERRARVLADIGLAKERESEVTQNHAKAFLDNAKTIAQINDIPSKRMNEVLKLVSQIRQKEKQETEIELQKDMKRADALKQG